MTVSSAFERTLAALSNPVGEAAHAIRMARERMKKVAPSNIMGVNDGKYMLSVRGEDR